jgi:hypothetical protein
MVGKKHQRQAGAAAWGVEMPSKSAVDLALKDLLDQVPGMAVRAITLMPAEPTESQDVTARIDIAGGGSVVCTISADGRLHSAQVFEP